MSRVNAVGNVLVAAAALALASPAAAQDRSTYPTNQDPSAFTIDWIGFYDTIDTWTKTTRAELDHALDIAYGPDPKQKLDLYLPDLSPPKSPGPSHRRRPRHRFLPFLRDVPHNPRLHCRVHPRPLLSRNLRELHRNKFFSAEPSDEFSPKVRTP